MKGTFCSSHLTSRATSLSLCSGVTLLERALYILNRIRTFSSIVSTSPSVFLPYLSLFSFTFLFLDRYRFFSKKKKKKYEKKYRCDVTDTIDRLIAGQPINFDFAVADCVLPPAGRNYPAHVARGTASR